MSTAEIITEYTETQATITINFYYSDKTHLHTISYLKGQNPKLQTNEDVQPSLPLLKIRQEIIQYLTEPYTLETFKQHEKPEGEIFRINDDPELILFTTDHSNLTIIQNGINTQSVNFTSIGLDEELELMLIEASRHCKF